MITFQLELKPGSIVCESGKFFVTSVDCESSLTFRLLSNNVTSEFASALMRHKRRTHKIAKKLTLCPSVAHADDIIFEILCFFATKSYASAFYEPPPPF